MSSDAADRAKFGEGVKGFLRQLEANMADWKTHIRPERREQFRRAEDRAEEFVRFRTELVRLGNEEGQAAAREWGDNNANRTNRQALNGEIDALATQNYAQLERLRIEINERSTRQLMITLVTMGGGILMAILLVILMVKRYRRDAEEATSALSAAGGGELRGHFRKRCLQLRAQRVYHHDDRDGNSGSDQATMAVAPDSSLMKRLTRSII
jgi:methyl-accepting chemotaxis protein